MMSQSVTPTVQRRRLGAMIRQARQSADMTREQVAEALECSVSTVQRIEAGTTGMRPKDLRALMDHLGVADPDERGEMESLARYGGKAGWWASAPSALRTSYQTYIGFEEAATDALCFESIYVPGLLQTEAYARDNLTTASPRLGVEIVERRVAVRMRRQKRLDQGLYLATVIDESAILRRVGGRQAWQDQLRHLLEQADRPNVTVQVLPFEVGSHPGIGGSFTVLRFSGDPDIAYIEQQAGGDLFLEGDDCARYLEAFEALRALALPAPMSVNRIHAQLKE